MIDGRCHFIDPSRSMILRMADPERGGIGW
jgi:hypothetical protein